MFRASAQWIPARSEAGAEQQGSIIWLQARPDPAGTEQGSCQIQLHADGGISRSPCKAAGGEARRQKKRGREKKKKKSCAFWHLVDFSGLKQSV